MKIRANSLSQKAKQIYMHQFDRAAATYDQAAQLQRQVGDELLNYLKLFSSFPQRIIDLGAGTGYFTRKLQQEFPDVFLCSLDMTMSMLKKSLLPQDNYYRICADFDDLPMQLSSFDLITANLSLHWSNHFPDILLKLHPVLQPGGQLLASVPGNKTFKELSNCYTFQKQTTNKYLIDENLLKTNLQVYSKIKIDRHIILLTFSSIEEILLHLRLTGTMGMQRDYHRHGLRGKSYLENLNHQYQPFVDQHGRYSLTYEIFFIYAER